MSDAVASLTNSQPPVRQAPAYDGAPDAGEVNFRDLWQDPSKGMTFADFLDIINPLQHIPVVSTIYRLATGDQISQGARMFGSILYGGPTGLLANGVVAAFEEASGNTVEGHLLALFEGDKPSPETPAPVLAANAPAATPVAKPDPAARTAGAIAAPARPSARLPAVPLAFAARPPKAAHFFPARPAGIIRRGAPAPVPPAIPPFAAETRRLSTPYESVAKPVGTDSAAAGKAAAERKRIAEVVARAQRAQAPLLLSSLGQPVHQERKPAGAAQPAEPRAAAAAPSVPFQPHPFLLPPGAPSEAVTRAMERALSKYQHALQTTGGAR